MRLLRPALGLLPGYVAALEQGWSPDNVRKGVAAREELEEIFRDRNAYVERQVDLEAKGPPVTLPDGTKVARIPGWRHWMWDGEFCGIINFRWQPGTAELPPHVLGHIGYAVVPWKRGRGYATAALGAVLREVPKELAYVELTTDHENLASQRVITANGGVLHEVFEKPEPFGGKSALRYRIHLREGS